MTEKMLNKISFGVMNFFKNYFSNINLRKSPWDDSGDETNFAAKKNIFNKQKLNQFNFGNFNLPFNKKIISLIIAIFFLLWLSSGIYEVKEGEEAAVIRFGHFTRKGFPGLNYHLPSPLETVFIEKVNQSRRIEIGYRSSGGTRNNDNAKFIAAEGTMVTGDENIFELNCDVMWHINDLEKFLFNVVRPEETVKLAAESAIREIIGKTPISSVLSSQKQEITNKIEVLTQKILDEYNAGVMIENVQLLKAEPPVAVIDAYRDVQTSKADKEREINQAQAYNNDILPKARGEAATILQEAEGYKQEIIARAQGDTQRFTAVYKQYSLSKQVTRDRLYLETAQSILQDSKKIIVGSGIVLPHMAVDPK